MHHHLHSECKQRTWETLQSFWKISSWPCCPVNCLAKHWQLQMLWAPQVLWVTDKPDHTGCSRDLWGIIPVTPGYTTLVVTTRWFSLCPFQRKLLSTATKPARTSLLQARAARQEPQRRWVCVLASPAAPDNVGDNVPCCSRDLHWA